MEPVVLLRRLAGLSTAEAVILLADLSINLGFFMLIPYLSIHVRDNLGLSATIAGTILAVRTGVQQVLMMFAGPTADLYGYKRVLITGLLIRAAGFLSFALMATLPGLLISAVLSGIGGALFSSAERAAFAALNPGPDQAGRFALLYTAQSVGTTLGPLVGALLLSINFRVLSVVAGCVYFPIALMVFLYLPDLATGRDRPAVAHALSEVLQSVATVARNRAFVAYCLISTGFWAVSGQINISLSLHASAVTGSQTAVKYLLLTNSLMVIAMQYKIAQWLTGRWAPLLQWVIGCALTGGAFLLLIPLPGMGGMVSAVVIMTLGGMLLRPNDYTMIVGMAPRDSIASYYGFSALAVAIGGSGGQFLGGRLLDVADATGTAWIPWLTFAVIGLVAAAGMALFARRNARAPGC